MSAPQHPLGVCALSDGTILIADSYNHRIKRLDASGRVTTIAGAGKAGLVDGQGVSAQFSEPGGLVEGPGGVVFVADTNNNSIRVLDVAMGDVRTLSLEGVPKPPVDPSTFVVDARGDRFPSESVTGEACKTISGPSCLSAMP